MANRLEHATSPYLLQHQDNPVDWWEWSEEAFSEARQRDVPILLSVGYAACHWCHVMAHESFEDPETATEMNELFVNVKVDREERPDVDSIYMEATQAMTGHGGWPMTVFLDHDGRPFFAGTYFPKQPHHGMPSFRQLLAAISTAWREQREDVDEQATRLVSALNAPTPAAGAISPETLQVAYRRIAELYDPVNGGFGRAPKFPQQPVLEFLLRVSNEPWAPDAAGMLVNTLDLMSKGGIRDHLGGGFARYSVDEAWLAPHFEKMLYDNAQLARLYLWAGVELDRPEFLAVARETLDYLATDLSHPQGGFFSSEDADSEGEEGKFYVWTIEEIREVLGDLSDPFIEHFGVTERGNFEGSNILNIVGEDAPASLQEAKRRLLTARERRVRPGLDDKVIASWNGLAIRAFAEAGAALGDESYIDIARSAARFAAENLMRDGALTRSWRDGKNSGPGFLDDHAAMAIGLYSLFAVTGEGHWFGLADEMVRQFHRFARPEGGFYTTPEDGEKLVKRPFDVIDNPMPSGNGMVAEALFQASMLTGRSDWKAESERAISVAAPFMAAHPTMVAHHLCVLYSSSKAKQLAVVGPDWQSLARVASGRFLPHLAVAPSASGNTEVPLLEGRESGAAAALAFVCHDFVCDMPTADPGVLAHQLGI